jgi:hypothetical protein
MENQNAVKGKRMSNLEALLSEFVAELQKPLDPQVSAIFLRCADRMFHREQLSGSGSASNRAK